MKKNFIACVPFYLLTVILLLGLVHWGNYAVTTAAQTAPVEREHTFVIDAGHGEPDGGATSCTGVLESTVNLQIALRLNDLLQLLGYDTRMIRTSEESVYTEGTSIAQKKVSDLKERVRIVNSTENGILISIHQNTFSDSRYGGAQVFYAADEESVAMAKAVQESFTTYLNPGSSRQCKKATGIYLMEHIENPGILIECGFLSNPEEEAKLRSDAYQKQLCCVIASAVSQMFGK